MPDPVDPLQYLVEAAKKTNPCRSLSNFITGGIRQVVSSIFGNLPSVGMDTIVDISSSDSELQEIDPHDPTTDTATSSKGRILPPWPSTTNSNAGASSSSSRMRRGGRSSNGNGRSLVVSHAPTRQPTKQPMHASSSRNGGPSHSYSGGTDRNVHVIEDDDIDNEQHASKRAKRPPPSSFHPNNGFEHMGGNVYRDSRGSYFQTTKGYSTTNGDIPNENRGNRMLPHTMAYGRSANSNGFGNASEPSQNRGMGEERPGTDERLVFQAAIQDINQPNTEANLPEGLLSVSLLRHQKIALAWMIKREKEGRNCLGGILADDQGLGKTISMISIILMHRSLQDEYKSENLRSSKVEALNLDDDDDVKNESNSLVIHEQKETVELDDIKVVSGEGRPFPHTKPAAGTLVVCPASVLRQWNRELEEKVTEEAKLSVLIYHGGNRTKDPVELAKYDVVLTTFAIVNNECPKQPSTDEEENEQTNAEMYGLSSGFAFGKKSKKAPGKKKGKKRKKGLENDASDISCGTIAKVRWFRVILDEAQTIKNHRTQVARACCSLRAKRRWCLSGTPIQNTIDEVFSYFRFLKYEPYCQYKAFLSAIKLPINRDAAKGYQKLQVILRSFMLRRTKETVIDGKPIISLPPKDIQLTKIEFSSEERAYYTTLESGARKQFKAYAAAGTLNQNYANILLLLLRLRQACDHPLLAEGVASKSNGKGTLGIPQTLPQEKLVCLLSLLEASSAICCVCSDPPEDACVSVCEHVFCFQCVSDYLTAEDNTCPVFGCRTQLNSEVLFTESALRKCLYGDEDGDASTSGYERSSLLNNDFTSSKIKAVVDLLHECLVVNTGSAIHSLAYDTGISLGNQAPESLDPRPIKAIVFSQWTGMLNLLEGALKNTGLIYRRLDGGMSLPARDRAVKEFNTNPEVTVMLMSLKAGNLGLNMVAACRVIMLDLWWNPTTEDQAIDRAHRIGQTRPVVVSRLTIKNTVEDRILALQEEKRKMVASAFGEDQSGGSATRLTMEDLQYLFGF